MTATLTTPWRGLITGGDPNATIAPPADEAFVQYLDEHGEPFNWDPDLAEEGEQEPEKRELAFLPAPELEAVANELIGELDEFLHLRMVRIVYRWKRDGLRVGGRARLSGNQKLSGLVADTLGARFLVWVAANHLTSASVTAWQFEALVYHELMHIRSGDGARDHDFAGFVTELQRYGMWRLDLRSAGEALRQLTMFESVVR